MTVSYSELVTQIRAYTEVDSSVLSDTIVNDFIEFAENRIFRDVDIDVFKERASVCCTDFSIVSSNVSCAFCNRIFSRTLSKITIVSLIENPNVASNAVIKARSSSVPMKYPRKVNTPNTMTIS